MPKAILEFDLEDFHEQRAHMRAVKSTSAYICLHELQAVLRQMSKYQSCDNERITNLLQNNEGCVELVELLRDVVYNIIQENDINMEDLE